MKLFSLFFVCGLVFSQAPGKITYVKTDPSGSCNNSTALQWNATSGNLSGCKASTWGTIATSGTSGSVTVNGVTCTLGSSCTVTANPTNAAAVVAAFTSCSGTQYLGADGSCHTASAGGTTVTAGTFASLPGSPTLNQTYIFSDSIYSQAWYDGSIWHYYLGGFGEMFPPSGLSWMNQGSCTLTTSYGGEQMTCPADGSTSNPNSGIRYQAYPGGSFTRTLKFRTDAFTSYMSAGIVLSDGTQTRALNIQWNSNTSTNVLTCNVVQCASVTSCTSNPAAPFTVPANYGLWLLRLGDDGTTNRTWSISYDGGLSYSAILVESRTTAFTPTRIGYFLGNQTTSATSTIWVASFN